MNRIDDWNEHYTTCTECGARYHASEGSHCDVDTSIALVALQYRLSGEDYSVRIFDTELEAEDYAFDWLEEQYENWSLERAQALGYTVGRNFPVSKENHPEWSSPLACAKRVCRDLDIAYIEITPVRVER
tara:strand:- start:215 stop:604 length:390 start_codon:yes stop_codon:yes gene_type:complete